VQQLCDLERVKPQPPPSLLLGLEPVQSCLGVARVMSEQKVNNYSVPVIFEPPCTKGKQHQGKKVLYIVSSIFSRHIVVSVADPMRKVSWMLFPGGTELGTQVKTQSRVDRTRTQ